MSGDGRLTRLLHRGNNPITLAGAVLTTSSAFTMIGFWILELGRQRPMHPYAGIILFLALPAVFVLGLLLMPVGLLWQRWRRRRGGESPAPSPVDLQDPFLRRALTWVGIATGVNIALLSGAAYQGVAYMDSTQFCGLTCHSVMAPEYTAYLGSPHARVACTQCHIGTGAGWFLRSKLSGTRQVLAVVRGTYARPIPAPVKHLRPSRETCEECHWPQKLHGDKLLVRRKYDSDEASTPLTTVLVLTLGGRTGRGAVGIHGVHLDPPGRISYVATDEQRQVIPRVTYRGDAGPPIEFAAAEAKGAPAELASGELRTMDCIDCHNRPAHPFERPERAVDNAIAEGRIGRELPFIKKKGVELLRAGYADRAAAARQIVQGLTDYYREAYPAVHRERGVEIARAADQLKAIYERNVFPEMNVGWGTYPNNIGHEDSVGCFRCHDDSHKSASGRPITQDCNACHTVLALDEKDPKILAALEMN